MPFLSTWARLQGSETKQRGICYEERDPKTSRQRGASPQLQVSLPLDQRKHELQGLYVAKKKPSGVGGQNLRRSIVYSLLVEDVGKRLKSGRSVTAKRVDFSTHFVKVSCRRRVSVGP